jgi:hypothetical protein
MEAAYRPIVDGELDTQNFEKFPEVSLIESQKTCHDIICGMRHYVETDLFGEPKTCFKTAC